MDNLDFLNLDIDSTSNNLLNKNLNELYESVNSSVDDYEFDKIFESALGDKNTKNGIKSAIKDANTDDGFFDKKAYKADIKEVKSIIKNMYKQYCAKCKSSKVKPISKNDYIKKALEGLSEHGIDYNESFDNFEEFDESSHDNLTTGKGSYPESKIAIPGGDSETPKSKPYDASNIPISSKKEITVDQYNKAITALQKAFKEGYEIASILENVDIVKFSTESKQEHFIESAIDEAIIEAYDNGPVYESVSRRDKKEIKNIVNELRKDINSALGDMNVKYHHPKVFARFSRGAVWSTYIWQIIGCIYIERGNVRDIVKSLNSKFNDKLGEYKILEVRVLPNIADAFKVKFGWKNTKSVYFLVVDTKLPEDLKTSNQGIKPATESPNLDQEYELLETLLEDTSDSFDSFDEFDEFFEASAMKSISNLAKGQVGKSGLEGKSLKKGMKEAVKACKKYARTEYKKHKTECKKNGSKPMKKKEFLMSIKKKLEDILGAEMPKEVFEGIVDSLEADLPAVINNDDDKSLSVVNSWYSKIPDDEIDDKHSNKTKGIGTSKTEMNKIKGDVQKALEMKITDEQFMRMIKLPSNPSKQQLAYILGKNIDNSTFNKVKGYIS